MSCKIDFINDWELKYQGAESRIYFGTHSKNRCVIKHRFSKKYRHQVLDKKLTRERTKRERRIIEKIKSKSIRLANYMPTVIWSNEDTLLMTEITNSENLKNYIDKTDNEISEIARLIGECVAELHNLGIIHGDLTTSNLLLVPRENDSSIIIPIDFGLSTGSNHPEERAVDLYVLERALISTHFADSTFFHAVLESYLNCIDENTCIPHGKNKIIERLREVRARGRKSDYLDDDSN